MKTILITVAILLSVSLAFGEEYIIIPTVPDLNSGDNFMTPGSFENPYLIIDSDTGREIGIMTPTGRNPFVSQVYSNRVRTI